MNDCHLLALDAEGISCFVRSREALREEGRFRDDASGQNGFREYLAARRHRRFLMLVNLADESYAQAVIPFLRGGDRRTLIERKCRQVFAPSALGSALSLGREKGRHREERILLLALNESDALQPWLQIIDETACALGGIYSPALLEGSLLKKLAPLDERCLLFYRLGETLRASYLLRGQTVFSRLISADGRTMAEALPIEAARLRDYLETQRQTGDDEELPVYMIAHPGNVDAARLASPDATRLIFAVIDNHAAARRFRLRAALPDDSCTPLLLHLLASRPPRKSFPAGAGNRRFRLVGARRQLFGLSLAGLLGGGLLAGNEYHQATLLNDRIDAARGHLEQRAGQQRAPTGRRSDSPLPPLGPIVELHAHLQEQARQPAAALLRLSQALDRNPGIELAGIDWQNPPLAATSPAAPETLTIRGNIRPAGDAPPRQIVTEFEKFATDLCLDAACSIEVVRAPFAGKVSLRIVAENDNAISADEPFELLITAKR